MVGGELIDVQWKRCRGALARVGTHESRRADQGYNRPPRSPLPHGHILQKFSAKQKTQTLSEGGWYKCNDDGQTGIVRQALLGFVVSASATSQEGACRAIETAIAKMWIAYQPQFRDESLIN